MSNRAHINVEEAADGLLNVMEVYEGGFDGENPAHRFTRALAKKASELSCEMVGDPSITVHDPREPIEIDAHPILAPGCGPVYPPS